MCTKAAAWLAILVLSGCASNPQDGSIASIHAATWRACYQDCLASPKWICTTKGAGPDCEVMLPSGGGFIGKHAACYQVANKFKALALSGKPVPSSACY